MFRQLVAAYEVRARFAQEHVAPEVFGKLIAAIHQRSAGRREAGELSLGRERVGLVAPVHARIHPRRPNLLGLGQLGVHSDRRFQIRIPGQIMGRQQVTANLIGVGVVEQPARVVVADAPLAARDRLLTDPRRRRAGGVAKANRVIG